MKKIRVIFISVIIILVLIGCAPSQNVNDTVDQNSLVMTAVKQTDDAQALQTEAAIPTETEVPATQVPEPTDVPPTSTTAPTSTPAPTAIPPTATSSGPCLAMLFISDVTIPDNALVTPGDPFTKTWRFRNTGSCSWDSSYKIEFDYGYQMGAPAQFSVPEIVFPGHEVDVTVSLVAPMDPGSYIGNFRIKSDNGIYFGIFYVQVTVPIPELADFNGNTLEINQSNFGSVDAAGNVTSYARAGDTEGDDAIQSFFKFNLSGIPATATVNAVYILIPSYSPSGNPFTHLGCMRVYSGAFFDLGAGDYGTGGDYEFVEYCSVAALSTAIHHSSITAEVQSSLASGSIELKLWFYQTQSNDDGVGDYVDIANLRLLIYYTP